MLRNNQLPIRFPGWRRRVLLLAIMFGFAALLVRSVYLQGLHTEFLQQEGDARYRRELVLSAHRGMITDRDGEPLAISTPMESICASPPDVKVDASQLKQLASLLQIKPAQLQKKISDDRGFVYLKRRMPPEEAARVMQLAIPGIFMQSE